MGEIYDTMQEAIRAEDYGEYAKAIKLWLSIGDTANAALARKMQKEERERRVRQTIEARHNRG